MQKAAKRKSFWLVVIASALVFCAPALASRHASLPLKTRAELSVENGQNGVESSPLTRETTSSYYDPFGEVASESSVAPKTGVGRSELGNALSGLGSNPLGRNINTLDEFGSGSAFSGVFDPSSSKFLAYPSGSTRLASGGAPINVVPRRGGHGLVNNVLSDLTGATRTNNVGFTMFLDDAGDISVDFLSRSVNGRNPAFRGNVVPESMQPQILDAIRSTTGRNVRGR
ncbi:MAG: hypothetical protein IH991_00875 [Planctomycetes bacterium]|nr:hypothetical protein [Planctomycetota bacterium]